MLQGQPARVEVPAELRLPLLLLYWANDLDQATPRELECGAEYAAGVLRQSRTVLPLLAASGAGEWVASLSQWWSGRTRGTGRNTLSSRGRGRGCKLFFVEKYQEYDLRRW